MSEHSGSSFGNDTVIVNKEELEAQLRIHEAETIREASAPLFDPEVEAILREIDGYEDEPVKVYVPESTAREPQPQPEPVYIRPEKAPDTNIDEIIHQRETEKKKKIHKRLIVAGICLAVVLAACLIIGMTMRSSRVSGEYTLAFEKAQSYYNDGDYDAALEWLRQALAVEKTDECLLLMSKCYEAKYDFVNAIAILESSKSKKDTFKSRIERLKKNQADYESGKIIVIAGKAYDVETTELDLSGKSLRSGRLDQLGRLTELTTLKLANNQITTLEFLAPLKKLVTLDLSENEIEDISTLARLTELRTLHLDKNAIKDFSPLYELKNLATLTICDMELKDTQLKELKEALPDCLIFSDEAKSEAVEIKLGGKTFKSDVTELDLHGCKINDVSVLSVCTKLTSLDLSDNFIKDISPLMDIPGLTSLDLSDNYISDIRPLMGMVSLTELKLGSNEISSITALSELKQLKTLQLEKNKLADVSPLGKLENLKTLDLTDNEDLTKKAVDELQQCLPKCKITSNALNIIELGGKSFSAESEIVDASELGLTDISAITGFTKLKTLDLRGNAIGDLSPLYGMSTLTTLKLSPETVSEEQITALQEALPECTIIIE